MKPGIGNFLALCTDFNFSWEGDELVSFGIVSIYHASTQYRIEQSLAGIVHLYFLGPPFLALYTVFLSREKHHPTLPVAVVMARREHKLYSSVQLCKCEKKCGGPG